MIAVIKTGGKQYVVSPDKKIKIEKLAGEKGSVVSFDQVLFVSDGKTHQVGTPVLSNARVEGTILNQTKDDKKIVFRYHAKTRYRKLKGHKQQITEVMINKISA